MIYKRLLVPERVRKIQGSFAFIEHRFLRDGFWNKLNHHERLLYVLLVLVADRQGLSYYSYDKLCSLAGFSVDDYVTARNALIDQDLLAFDGTLFQVLELPEKPEQSLSLRSSPNLDRSPVSLAQLFSCLKGGLQDG
jgi:hypothetical protein